MKLKVMKFGGTSVGSVEALQHVREIVSAGESAATIVVVSAMSGVTDTLMSLAGRAAVGDTDLDADLDTLRQRHHYVASAVCLPDMVDRCHDVIDRFLGEVLPLHLANILNNTLSGTLSAQDKDTITDAVISLGEVVSSAIVAAMIPGIVPHISLEFVKTRRAANGANRLEVALTNRLIRKEFGKASGLHVTQGFIARDADSNLATNLGRGGSDYTAALIAAALHADILEIWTDVDGFYDADPRTHPDAQLLPQMTYAEAQALCDAGAKVVYAPTLKPVERLHIPVLIKNTFNPAAAGTVIQ